MRISDWSSDVCSSDLVVAISDDAADRRWIGALRIAESAADAELQPVAALHDQCAEHAGVLAAPGRMPDHPRLGILVGLLLDQVVAATGLVIRAAPLPPQAFATRVLHRGHACIPRGTLLPPDLLHQLGRPSGRDRMF